MIFRITFDQAVDVDSANRVVWTWGFLGPAGDSTELAALTDIVLTSLRSPEPVFDVVQSLDPLFSEFFENVGGPAVVVQDLASEALVGVNNPGPQEVQIAISRMISSPRGLSPLGRQFFGPIVGALMQTTRPSSTTINELGAWALAVHDEFVTAGATPAVIRAAGTPLASEAIILGYSIDNAWDTQRRRGVQATSRSVFDIV